MGVKMCLPLSLSHSQNFTFFKCSLYLKNNHICKCQQNYTAILLLFLLTTFTFFSSSSLYSLLQAGQMSVCSVKTDCYPQ